MNKNRMKVQNVRYMVWNGIDDIAVNDYYLL